MEELKLVEEAINVPYFSEWEYLRTLQQYEVDAKRAKINMIPLSKELKCAACNGFPKEARKCALCKSLICSLEFKDRLTMSAKPVPFKCPGKDGQCTGGWHTFHQLRESDDKLCFDKAAIEEVETGGCSEQ